ncbi:dethiobiotin synthase [Kaistella flava (ex Peng et al. 2021)]|uniref:ATP-dependent dethiobiotin synthetase BioD n=1 Tax=Kaistella flava (ex Peng et al. 2021) TaxID=2038776 RepID=A0A7M2Y5S7_9FLAO|nr:dethiobiotin synthase [Kaistella flava (ex Peng et al. 2021)]QOW09598.1 dethiobiotin synthase [Kaistella flava (ex Peng et al. 2021)]
MNTPKKLFVTGIGTGIGKTICSAILVEYLKADYWKPIQSGDLDQTDSMLVQSLVNNKITIHPERHRFKLAASPHKSAAQENISIHLEDFELPETENHLIVEGAGGLWVPLSDEVFMLDLIKKLKLPVVLVAKDYLGCINHTLLSIESLRKNSIPIAYFIFNGTFDEDTFRVIKKYLDEDTQILHIPNLKTIEPNTIREIANKLKNI